jgi:CBS domain-containing protein
MKTRLVRDLIHNQEIFVAPETLTVMEAARRMQASNVGALMIVDGRRLIGIFTERDALFRVIAAGLDPRDTKVSAVMTRDPLAINPDKTFGYALHLMYENGFRHVPVVLDGIPVGMVSARDALSSEVADFEAELSFRDDISEILA